MSKFTRKQFIAILESGKYTKITGSLYNHSLSQSMKQSAGAVCAIGAALKETDTLGSKAAKGYKYLPQKLVDDLEITPDIENRIWTTNDSTGNDNWAAVIAMLKKEWNITDTSEVNVYEAMSLLDSYYTEYYTSTEIKEDFGYNT